MNDTSVSSEPKQKKSFFWSGKVEKNAKDAQAVLDIRVRKSTRKPNHVTLYTGDVPPFPITASSDALSMDFALENNLGYNIAKYSIIKITFLGKQLFDELEKRSSSTTSPSTSDSGPKNSYSTGKHIILLHDSGEWTFLNVNGTWVLYFITVRVNSSLLSKFFVTLPSPGS